MQIREATDQDIPGILGVLKESLGESSSKKTEEVWRYKHIDNPFGKSLVLVAVEEEEIIGVRAFMRWEWQKGSQIFLTFRAVDTATHPDHQGKGIFKKLTLKALEIAKKNGDHFVFNTPNEQSKPGYLKMGWVEIAKIKVSFRFVNPFYWTNSVKKGCLSKNILGSPNSLITLMEEVNFQLENSGKIFTPKTSKYLTWRYEKNPLQNYFIKATDDYFIVGYIRNHSKFQELRIVEMLTKTSRITKEIKLIIDNWAKEHGVQIISFAPMKNLKFLFGFSGNLGPVLTLRDINLNDREKENLFFFKNWYYSLGDLELF